MLIIHGGDVGIEHPRVERMGIYVTESGVAEELEEIHPDHQQRNEKPFIRNRFPNLREFGGEFLPWTGPFIFFNGHAAGFHRDGAPDDSDLAAGDNPNLMEA